MKIVKGSARPVYLDPAPVIASPETGLLYSRVKRDDTVKRGATLALITDFFGKKIAEVKSPVAGKVLYIVATPPITKGQPSASSILDADQKQPARRGRRTSRNRAARPQASHKLVAA